MTTAAAVDRAGLTAAVDEVLPVLRGNAAAADASGEFPVESLTALRTSGLMGLLVPRAYGGWGGGLPDLTRVAGHLAGACLPSAFAWAMHCQQVDAIVRHGLPSLRDRLLPRIARDGAYLASITTESRTGGRVLRAHDALETEGDGYRFRRTAPVVTGGRHADGFVMTLRTSPEGSDAEVSLVYADRDQLVVETAAPGWRPLGMRGVENVSLVLDGRIPADQVIGGLGGFREILIRCFGPAAHIGWAACWLGAARAVYSDVIRQTRAGRLRSVDPTSDLVRHRLASIRCRLEAVSAYLRCVVDEVAGATADPERLDAPATQVHVNTLKVLAARETFAAVDELIDLVGMRTGYLSDGPIPLERTFRDLRAARLTYDDAVLLTANGSLALLDPAVRTAGG